MAGEEVRFERQIQATDASTRFCEVRLTRLLPAQGRLIRASMLDITERKRADQRLERALAELRALLNTLPDLVWLKDPDGAYLRCNHRFEQLFGASEAEIAGRTDYDFVDRAQADFFRDQDRIALVKGGPHAFEEMVRFADDGHEELLETIKTPVTTADGQLLGILGIGRDITGRQRNAELQKKLDAELHQAQKLDSLGGLAGGVAHDMNNVLAAIQAVVQTLKWNRSSDPDLSRALELIDQASTRGRDLVKGLTNFARRDLSEPELLDLNELVRTEVELLRRTTLQKLELVVDLEQPLPMIMGERGTLGSALMNLCVNAVDAMPRGGTLTLRTRRLEAMVELEVHDTGQGMSPEVAARAMEPFFTTKPIGKGTGLGLASVYVTAKAHGGSVDIQSTPGAGTLVRVSLPARSESSHPAVAEASQLPSAPLQVLLVDDDELIRFTVPRLVELLGHQVVTCAGGREALDLLETGRPLGLVILDLNMPGMDGAETLGRIRQLRPDLPVLVATGHLDAETAELLKADPRVASIAKPFTLADLDRKIQDFT
jgi:PAS domain S-box-containing protein